jgi:ABC-type glutathione transport system ATPase component
MQEELLQLKNLSVDYRVKGGYLSAVKDVNLSINKSEIFAIVGESGCGKSTVAHSIMRLLNKRYTRITGESCSRGPILRVFPTGR